MPDNPRDDDSVIRRYRQNRDVRLLSKLFDRYSKDVYLRCLAVVRDGSVAEDLTQDAFLRAFQKIDQYRGGDFAAWVKQIAFRICLNWLREERAHPTQDLEGMEEKLSVGPEDFAQREDMEAAIADLAPRQQLCLRLRYFEQLSYVEIMGRTGFSYAQVRTYLQNGVRMLRQHFEQETR
jgi:RNA polymerase sigma-70 factor (ECF subfamily)